MIIRKENKNDYEAVYKTVKSAFENAKHSDGNEHELVNRLRNGKSYIPELSLVAELDKIIVGHIMFTRAYINDFEVLALAPLSVVPSCQNQGIGSQLIKKGHRIAKDMGYTCSIVLGSETYYPRFGYETAEKYNITAPFDVPKENFMVYFTDKEYSNKISGTVLYAPEFGI